MTPQSNSKKSAKYPVFDKKNSITLKKDLGMEEISPTIPSIMYLKYLHFRRSSHSCQGKIQYALYQDNLEDIQCPHCKSKNYYRHGFCYRKALLANHENTLRRVRIQVQRYRCKDCGKTYVMGCEKIGLLKYQRRNI